MVQLLASLIEWLAMVALTSVGIEYEPAACAVSGPAEYRPAAAVLVRSGEDFAVRGFQSASDCAESAVYIMQIDQKPLLINDLPGSYDS